MESICHDLLIDTSTALLSQPSSGGNLSPKSQSLEHAGHHFNKSLQISMKEEIWKDLQWKDSEGSPMADNNRSNV